MSPGPALEKFNDPRQPPACEAYPGKHCSASECLAASKFLRELIAYLDIEEAKKPAWWRMIWGISEARRHYALAAEHAEDLARERTPNPTGLVRESASVNQHPVVGGPN